MAISKKEVHYLAHLARIGLTDKEIEHFQGQLDGILAYVDKLKGLDVAGIEPTSHVLGLKDVLRPDELRPSLGTEEALRSAPQQADGFYKVPKVIE